MSGEGPWPARGQRSPLRRTGLGAGLAVAVLAQGGPAEAGHSYTELYNPWYVVGVAFVVAVSFVLIAVAMRSSPATRPPGYVVAWLPPSGSRQLRALGAAGRALAVAGLVLVVIAGLTGSRIETWNIAPALVWVVAWKAIVVLQLLLGDVWAILNPWHAVFDRAGRERRPPLAYPSWLGTWPAAALFLGVVWFETATAVAREPRVLGVAVLGYSVLTWAGMALFGASVWLSRVECFTVFFRLLTAGAPLAVCDTTAGRGLVVRPPAIGFLGRPPTGLDAATFVLFVLAGGMFAGLLETRSWESLRVARGLAPRGTVAENTVAFLGFVALTVAVYWLSCALVRLVAGPALSARGAALAFASALIPLAVGFHLTHGLDHTLENLQLLLRLASDPLGAGWNLFGTRTLRVVRPDASLVWQIQLAVIVLVHVAGIWVAHAQALALYPERGAAIRSQVPMIGVMIVFTISGLWILSRIPILL
jgi:hypothetical protein